MSTSNGSQRSPGHKPTLLSKIFISPDERRLRAGWRILAHTVLLTFIFILISIAAFPILFSTPGYTFLANHVAALIAITAATFLARRWLDRRSVTSLGLVWDRTSFTDLLVGIFLPGLMFSLIFLLEWVPGWLSIDSIAWDSNSPGILTREMSLYFLVFVTVGWQEELLSRGYWLQNFADGIKMPLAILITSFLFALGHLANPNISLTAILGLAAAGGFFAYCYLATNRLWLPIGLHIGWNFFEGPVFGFPVSGLTNFFTLINHTVDGPPLLTGGAFGPEAGLVQFPALVLGVVIILVYTRSRRQTIND